MGALLLALTHPSINVLGVNVNYPSIYSGLAASSLVGYYNRSDVPIGMKRPFTNDTFFDAWTYQSGEYASKVAYHWREYAPGKWQDTTHIWDPVQLYRKLLASQPDKSITIASIGFLSNVSASTPCPNPRLLTRDILFSYQNCCRLAATSSRL